MTCKDCIHYEVCKDTVADENWTDDAPKEFKEMFSPKGCENFKNKSDYVTKDEIAQLMWERDKAIEQLRSYGVDFCQEKKELAEVKHGEWEDRPNPQWKAYDIRHCSKCGWNIPKNNLRKKDLNWKYCPNCGAKMDKGEEENDRNN